MAPSLQSVSLTRGTTLHSADFPHHKPLGPRLPSQPRGPTGSLGRPAHTVPGPCDDKERGKAAAAKSVLQQHTHTQRPVTTSPQHPGSTQKRRSVSCVLRGSAQFSPYTTMTRCIVLVLKNVKQSKTNKQSPGPRKMSKYLPTIALFTEPNPSSIETPKERRRHPRCPRKTKKVVTKTYAGAVQTNLVTSTVTRPLLPYQETAVHRVPGGRRLLSWRGCGSAWKKG